MIWIDASRPDWSERGPKAGNGAKADTNTGAEKHRFKAPGYVEAAKIAMSWGATVMVYKNGRRFEKSHGSWQRIKPTRLPKAATGSRRARTVALM